MGLAYHSASVWKMPGNILPEDIDLDRIPHEVSRAENLDSEHQ